MTSSEILYDYAISFLAVPYRYGGDDFTGMDCSGFCIELLMASGLWAKGKDATAQGIYDIFKTKSEHNRIDFGSLIFFGSSVHSISHIGFALNRYHLIEAGGGNRKTLTVQDAAKDNAWVRIRPISFRGDMVASLTPYYPFVGS